tara:strand:- start:236 stop:733 length:498 start_codon:yes stop_codon:yes gene_type:complete
MTESAVASIIVSIFLFLASLSAIMYGWGEAYLNGRRLASRSEASTLKNSVLTQLSELEKESIKFWTFDSTSSPSKDLCLITTKSYIERINSLRKLFEQLEAYGIAVNVTEEFKLLRKYITLDMERAYSLGTDRKISKVSEIIYSAEEIRMKVSYSFIKTFQFAAP